MDHKTTRPAGEPQLWGGQRGEGPGGSPRPAPAGAPSRLGLGGGRTEAPPSSAGSRAPRPARGRHSALPAHPSLTPREGRGEGARRRSREGGGGGRGGR